MGSMRVWIVAMRLISAVEVARTLATAIVSHDIGLGHVC